MTTIKSKADWLKLNGFNNLGVTYLVVGDSYTIKDDLKKAGFRFSELLRWHTDNKKFVLPDFCLYVELKYDDYFIWDNNEKTSFLQNGARDKINLIFNPLQESHSQFVGELGERLRDILTTVRAISGKESFYGYQWSYIFEDESGNAYSWRTTCQQAVSVGMKCLLSGTIKDHFTYKGVSTTLLTHCRLKDA